MSQNNKSQYKYNLQIKSVLIVPFLFLLLVTYQNVYAENHTVNVVQDTYIVEDDSKANVVSLSNLLDVGITGIDKNVCTLIEFDDNFLPDGDAIIDSADLSFFVTGYTGDNNKKIQIAPLLGAWQESQVSWTNVPVYIFGSDYSVDAQINISKGREYVDITKLVKAWSDGNMPNDGLIMCYDSKSDDSQFEFGSHNDGGLYLSVDYHYPTAVGAPPINSTVGVPPVSNDVGGNAVILNNSADTAQTVNDDVIQSVSGDSSLVISNINNNSVQNSGDAVELVSPTNGVTRSDPKPLFTWKYTNLLSKDLRPSVVVKGDSGEVREIMLDAKDVSYAWDEAFDDGKYTWYVELLKGSDVVQTTGKYHFIVDTSVANKKNNNSNTNAVTTTKNDQVRGNDAKDKKGDNNKVENSSASTNQNINNKEQKKAVWNTVAAAVVVIISIIVVIILSIILYKKNKKESNNDKNSK